MYWILFLVSTVSLFILIRGMVHAYKNDKDINVTIYIPLGLLSYTTVFSLIEIVKDML